MDSDREMLDRWAANLGERRIILEFLDWCAVHEPRCLLTTGDTWPTAMNAETLLDAYHEINLAQLERERRAVVEEASRDE